MDLKSDFNIHLYLEMLCCNFFFSDFRYNSNWERKLMVSNTEVIKIKFPC